MRLQWEEHVWNKDVLFLIFFISHLLCFKIILSFSTSLPENLKPFPYFSPLFSFSVRPVPSPKITASQQWWEGTMGLAHTQPSALSWADTGGSSVTAAGPAHRLWLTCFIGEMTSLEQTFWKCLPATLQQQGTVPPSRATPLALENAA